MPPSFEPTPPVASLRARIEDAVAGAITAGQFEPGTVVSVPTLAAQFGVSATPVREAMLNLQKAGFVEPVRNKGFRVTEVLREDLEEIVELRRMLEVPPLRGLAAAYPASEDARLRELAQRITDAAAAGDLVNYLAYDRAFHIALLELHGNSRLVEMVASLRRQTRLTGLAALPDTPQLHESAVEHGRLLDLLAAGDGEGAAELMARHIGHVLGWWSGEDEREAAASEAADTHSA